ncbi:MAG: murein biosynthesis integral membrane protein MurJ [Winkia neuii]|uniref:murein biosynthesis integral membrane protein MurJ n=1 Tax=Winkia neuii TaxID=33007 RepID=UPI00241F97D0|nr:murein biosynthesis integral membrane protein MurJ [Winkia neuii]MBS5947221.1 murein biosynthesis integral membrane protein MurJ [Winkia neuii]
MSRKSRKVGLAKINVARATGIMAAGTAVSRVLGFIRAALLIAIIGEVGANDAFQAANTLPNTVYNLIASSVLSAVLVPQIVRALSKGGDEAEEYINRLLTFFTVGLALITVVAVAAAPFLVKLYAYKFAHDWYKIAVAFAFWCLPQVFFYGMYALWGQLLNAMGKFGPYMWSPVVNNVVGISGMGVFLWVMGDKDWATDPSLWSSKAIALLGGITTLGIVAQALILLPPLYRTGFRLRPVWGFRGHGLGQVSKTAFWAFAALMAGQGSYLVVSNVAAAGNGVAAKTGEFVASTTAYNTAFMIYQIPIALVVVSLITALFTKMSQMMATGDLAGARRTYNQTIIGIGSVTVFCAAALAMAAVPVMQVIMPRFDAAAISGYAGVVAVMAFNIPFLAIWSTSQSLLLSQEDTKTSFFVQAPMAIVVAIVAGSSYFLLNPTHWVQGAAAGELCGWIFAAIVGCIVVDRRLPGANPGAIVREYAKYLGAIAPAVLVGWVILHFMGAMSGSADSSTTARFAGALARVTIVGFVMLGIYLAGLFLLRSEGVKIISGPLAARLHLGRSANGAKAENSEKLEDMTSKPEEAVATEDHEEPIISGRDAHFVLLPAATAEQAPEAQTPLAATATQDEPPVPAPAQKGASATAAGAASFPPPPPGEGEAEAQTGSTALASTPENQDSAAAPASTSAAGSSPVPAAQAQPQEEGSAEEASPSKAADQEAEGGETEGEETVHVTQNASPRKVSGVPLVGTKNAIIPPAADAEKDIEANTASFEAILMGQEPANSDTSTRQLPMFGAAPKPVPPRTAPKVQRRDEEDDSPLINPVRRTMIGAAAGAGVALLLGLILVVPPLLSSPSAKEAAPKTSASQSQQGGATKKPSAPTAKKPEIAAVASLDPEGDQNEHPEDQDKMVDGDPQSVWMSRYYQNPKFGFKSGIGVSILLKDKAKVSQVTVATPATGGTIELRSTSADKPHEGEPLATGEFAQPTTTLKLKKPVEADSLVLWISELPRDGEGRNRAVISEITVK